MNRIIRYAPITRKYGHNSILFRKRVDRLEEVTVPDGHDFRLAGADDLDFIRRHDEALAGQVYSGRLNRGDLCYCLARGGDILGYNWVARSLCCVLCGFDRGVEFLPLGEGQAFTYDFYTYEAVRGSGIGRLTKSLLLQHLARQGVHEVFTLVMPYSTASLRIHLKAGYEPRCMVYGYRLFGWSRTYYGRPEHKPWLDKWIRDFKAAADIG